MLAYRRGAALMANNDLDMAVGVFSPSVLLPSQTTACLTWTGEKRLALAILEQAVANWSATLGTRGHAAERLRCQEELWFSSDERVSPLAFLNICDWLGINPGYLRAGLAMFRRKNRRLDSRQWKKGIRL